jgi:prepilin-type N-terminal cleavage/methylation domain-containing protein
MTISTKNLRRRAAFTLVEMMIVVGIGSLVFAGLASLTFYTSRSFAAMSNYVDLDRQSRNALDHMTQKVRSATTLDSFSTNALTFTYEGQNLSYTYSPSAKTLTETFGSSSTILLKDCQQLQFSMFQRNVVSNSFDQYTTTSLSTAKSVIVTWTCSRSLLGNLINSESVQSARIVIRNNP